MDTTSFVQRREFWMDLARNFSYRTPVPSAAWAWTRTPLLATLRYHVETCAIVVRSGLEARNGTFNRVRWAEASHDIFRVAERCGGQFNLTGLQHVLRDEKPVVFVANHMSSIETLVLSAIILPFRDIAFVVKKSLLSYPFFGPVARATRPLSVTRKNVRSDFLEVLKHGVEFLKSDRSIIVFPQATRTDMFDPASFNSLGVKLAAVAGVRAIPLALKTDFLRNGRFLKDFGRVDPSRPIFMEFGEPIDIKGNGRDAHRQIVQFIADRIERWGGEVKKPAQELTGVG